MLTVQSTYFTPICYNLTLPPIHRLQWACIARKCWVLGSWLLYNDNDRPSAIMREDRTGIMVNQTVIDENTSGTARLLESHLTDGSRVYAVQVKDREENWVTFDCVTQQAAIDFVAAYLACSM